MVAAPCGVLLLAGLTVTGCHSTQVHTRTVYVPTPMVQPAPPPLPPPSVVAVAPVPAPPPIMVIRSETDFYEPLSGYGRWEAVAGYGRCWIPSSVAPDWRPYTDGVWRHTELGWYWASNEPWGWATYHYGRWDWRAGFGWFWVPQTQWAPAWVCWRGGGEYVGWAPLRPSVSVGVDIHWGGHEAAFASHGFVFVEQRRMLEPVRPRTVIANNTTIINQTVNITKVKIVNQTVINEGPRPEQIARVAGRQIETASARIIRERDEAIGRRQLTARTRAPEMLDHSEVRVTAPTSPHREFPAIRPNDVAVQAKPEPRVTNVTPSREPNHASVNHQIPEPDSSTPPLHNVSAKNEVAMSASPSSPIPVMAKPSGHPEPRKTPTRPQSAKPAKPQSSVEIKTAVARGKPAPAAESSGKTEAALPRGNRPEHGGFGASSAAMNRPSRAASAENRAQGESRNRTLLQKSEHRSGVATNSVSEAR